ncbi:hypothetical protein BC829DRAFT_181009 [Chytridium lagenaria]|nr:hypothetical protein BC829DRAFT_181009 [Chytridium lagenaria]
MEKLSSEPVRVLDDTEDDDVRPSRSRKTKASALTVESSEDEEMVPPVVIKPTKTIAKQPSKLKQSDNPPPKSRATRTKVPAERVTTARTRTLPTKPLAETALVAGSKAAAVKVPIATSRAPRPKTLEPNVVADNVKKSAGCGSC